MKRKSLATLFRRFLAGALLCLLLVTPAFAAEGNSGFTDVTGSEYYAWAARTLSEAGILDGYTDGSFRAGRTINRAEMAAVICRMMNLPLEDGETTFQDVPADYWGAKYIAAAQKAGIISGDGKGSFRPEDTVKYEEAIKMVVCAIGQGNNITSSGANWAEGYLTRAQALGITENLPGKGSTRGDVAVMVRNALQVPTKGTQWRFLFVILTHNNFTAKDTAGNTVKDTHVMDQEELNTLTRAIQCFQEDLPVISEGKVQPKVNVLILDDAPITHLSTCSSGLWFSHDDAYAILKDRVNLNDYDHVTVIGDLRSLKLGYWGLGGTWFQNKTGYTFIKAADTNLWAMDQRWAPEVFVHELLHFVSNWADLRGYKVPVHLHSSAQYGYQENNQTGEKEWLVDFVNNAVPVGDGTFAGIPAEVWTKPPRLFQ